MLAWPVIQYVNYSARLTVLTLKPHTILYLHAIHGGSREEENMKTETEKQSASTSLVGTIRRFGKDGVLYEVLRQVDDKSVMIRVLNTHEETQYPTVEALNDPDE